MTSTPAPSPEDVTLRQTLIVIAVAYATMGAALMSLQGTSAGAFGRIVVVLGLCLLTSRGANWARLLLGVFIVPIALLLLLRLDAAGSFGWQLWTVVASMLVALGEYCALFFRRGTAAAFARLRAERNRPAAA